MNNWLKIGVPVVIAVLLVLATVGITLAVSGKAAVGKVAAPASAPAQDSGAQYARGLQCSNCALGGQPAVTGDPDAQTTDANISRGATCPSCPGYNGGAGGQPAVTTRGGCCGGR
jgi:hypothetical protein